ncbi:IPT/TIG domain-containing protein [Polaromonas sp. P1-6]|nr:IPT/TIG domain-containing protein [Polaromonas sp. P1-6]
MIKPKYYLVATTLILLAWAPHAGAGGRGSTPSPVIESVEIDPVQHRLTLTGNYFGGSTPLLTIGKHRLEVSESTQTQVVAKLPVHLHPATYRLSVSNRPSFTEATSLYLHIPAALEVISKRDR